MCHGDNRIVLERGAYRLLHCLVCLNVKITCRLIEENDLVLPQKGAGESEDAALARVLATEPPRALVIGIQSDGLFMPSEQREIAGGIPGARLVMIPSPEGHDGFLLEFELINEHILGYLKEEFPEYYRTELGGEAEEAPTEDFSIKKTSMFGEAEADITRW